MWRFERDAIEGDVEKRLLMALWNRMAPMSESMISCFQKHREC